jgi:hypothetical protein
MFDLDRHGNHAGAAEHIRKAYHLTGPQSENMHFFAQEYSQALGRTITFQDISVEPWRKRLLERGLPVLLVNHHATMADLHRGATTTGCRTTCAR